MKLGIAYNSFDGIELLGYAIESIRKEVDFICLIRQEMSFHGNKADLNDLEAIDKLKKYGLADSIVNYTPNLSLSSRENETIIRNLGLDQSIENGCSHHISADVDEFYLPNQLKYAKEAVLQFDCSIAESIDYFKHPTWKVVPERRNLIPLIHPVENRYEMNLKFPFPVDITRRQAKYDKCLVLDPEKFIVHHMTYVRNNIHKKALNNINHKNDLKNNLNGFDKYKLGDRLVMPPDYLNRKTVETINLFGIEVLNGSIVYDRS